MSKERARRRAVREAEQAKARAARARLVARRDRRRAVARRLKASLPKRRRVGRLLPRRTPGQRALIVGCVAAAILAIWYEVTDLDARIALTAVVLIATPAVVVLAFGRRSS